MPSYEPLFLKALVLTIAAEMLMGAILRKFSPKHFSFLVSGWRFYFFVAIASFMTLPYVWFIWPFFLHSRIWYLLVCETWAWLMEAVFYFFVFRISFKKALLFSFLLNGFSLGLGLIIKL